MYRFIDYKKIFELEQTGAPAVTDQPMQQPANVTGKNAQIIVELSDSDIDELSNILHGAVATVFTRPARLVDKKNPEVDIILPGMTVAAGEKPHIFIAFAIASAETTGTPTYPPANLTGENAAKTLIFNVLPKELAGVENIDSGAVSLSLNTKAGDSSSAIGITLIKNSGRSSAPTEPAMPTETTPEPQTTITPDQAEEIAATGDMMPGVMTGANPRAIRSFDEYIVHEAKKNWIANSNMKNGKLKKNIGKNKITNDVLKKEGAKLEKKDKDKTKPGLQLNMKDAKKHKKVVLAKTLMKISGAIDESKEGRIKGAKDQLVKLHEIIEKMIKETSNKNNKSK